MASGSLSEVHKTADAGVRLECHCGNHGRKEESTGELLIVTLLWYEVDLRTQYYGSLAVGRTAVVPDS